MFRYRVCAAVLTGVLVSPADASACGDKFLVPSRGARFQDRTVDRASAAVLVFDGATMVARASRRTPMGTELRRAGYRPTVATTEIEFGMQLHARRWDIVLIDSRDEPVATRELTATSLPLLPVTSTTNGKALVKAVDKAVAETTKARKKAGTRAGD